MTRIKNLSPQLKFHTRAFSQKCLLALLEKLKAVNFMFPREVPSLVYGMPSYYRRSQFLSHIQQLQFSLSTASFQVLAYFSSSHTAYIKISLTVIEPLGRTPCIS